MGRYVPILIASLLLACRAQPEPGQPATVGAPARAASALSSDATPATLRSWNDAAAKRAIVDFVGRVTREGGPDFVPVADRIATFDNDGTLWAEKPVPFQILFTVVVMHEEGGQRVDRSEAPRRRQCRRSPERRRGCLQ